MINTIPRKSDEKPSAKPTPVVARNDVFNNTGLTEDSSGIVTLDVMKNDSGGKNLVLWSVDNGVNAATDLLIQDKARTREASTDRSANGGVIWITNDGKVGYDITTVSTTFKAQLQALAAGGSLEDTFAYAIKLGSTISWATATINISGVNDPASISGTATGALTEDNATNTANGTISVADVDGGEAVFQPVLPAALAGTYGNFTFNVMTGIWGYTLDNSKVVTQALTSASIVTDSLTVKSADGTAEQAITITIAGTNDIPVISGATSGSVTEDTDLKNIVMSFGAASLYTVGTSYPNSVAIGDVNGDHKPDIVTSDAGINSVSVLLGNGLGAFALPDVIGVGAVQPLSVVLEDVNDDGNLDIITADAASSAVSVLLGNGLGAFGAPGVFGVGATNPHSVVAMDLNGDGKRDIVTANTGSNTVSVLLGNGFGIFGAPNIYGLGATSNQPASIAVADINGDSYPDIVTANYGSNNVSILYGDGVGAFSLASELSVGASGPFGIAVTDMNGDNRLDIVTVATDSNAVSVLLSSGPGIFGAPSLYDVGGLHPDGMDVVDVDGDGNLDIVTVNFNSNDVSVLRGDGVGAFAAPSVYSAGASHPYAIAVEDITGDGKPDIVTADLGSNVNAVSVLLNKSRGDLVTSGMLSISDPDTGESSFVAQSDVLGNHGYGRFSIDTAGVWHYTADNNQSAIQALDAGEALTDSFTVASIDGSVHQDITVTIVGVTEALF